MIKRRKTELSERGVWESVELEKHVLAKIRALLQYSGIEVYVIREVRARVNCEHCRKSTFVAMPSERGIPDLIGYIPPRTLEKLRGIKPLVPYLPIPFFIEVKRPKGGVRRLAQVAFIERAQRDGVLAFFANSWAVVYEEFGKIGIKLPAG